MHRLSSPEIVFRHHYFFVIQAPTPVLLRIYRMTEERPRAEHASGPVTDEDVAVSAQQVGKLLKQRTDAILAEDLPEEISEVLARLRETNRARE